MSGKMPMDDQIRRDWKLGRWKTKWRIQELADLYDTTAGHVLEVLFGPGVESLPEEFKSQRVYRPDDLAGTTYEKKEPHGFTITQWRKSIGLRIGDSASVLVKNLHSKTKTRFSGTVIATYPRYCLLQVKNYKMCVHWTDIERGK